MTTADALHHPILPKTNFKPIIENHAVKRKLANVGFDPEQHLAYEEPENILMMTDIGYPEDTGISPVPVSQPFRLFSGEAIQKFRDEALSDEVMSKCFYNSNIAACHLRGYVPK